MEGVTYGGDLHCARLLPEFSRLQAILGRKLRDTDSWAPYARLVALHSWKRVIRAAEQADPDKRWAPDLERLCQQYAKDEAEASLEPPPRPPLIPREERAKRAAEFARIRNQVMEGI